MNSGLEDMDEEVDGEHQSANNSMITTPDTTLDTEGVERTSPDVTRALLLHRTNSPESTRHSTNLSRSSYDNHGSDESHTRLIDVRRGEAPAYETIDLDLTEGSTPAPRRQNSQSGRISGFLSRFMSHRGNDSDANEPIALSPPPNVRNSAFSPSHAREPSVQSGGTTSADLHGSPGGSHLGRTHRDRVNNSSTGSVFTVLSKTLSRHHDDIPLTSPSLISLNSISPPLTHTATRTEFTYPRTGPTSEQVKFLASKETFGRFGLPYGPDAVAFASSSRLDLPPDFDSIHRPSFSDLSPNPDNGSASSLRSTSARRLSTGDGSDRGGSPFPESVEPSPDLASLTEPSPQLSLSKQKSSPNLGADVLASPSQSSLSKQKSTPNIGAGHPPLSKSASKSKLMASLQNDGGRSFPPRSVSAASSYLTVESFRTAPDDGDDSRPSSPTSTIGLVPEITVQLPSNNPSSTDLAEDASGSETEEFYDGDEGTEGSESGDEEVDGVNGGGNKTPRAASMNEGHQSHTEGTNQENVTDGPSNLSDEGDTDSSASESDPNGTRGTRIRTPTSSPSSSDLESGSDDESETETHSNHTEIDKNLVTVDLETGRIPHIREGTDVTLTPELVAATLGTSSPDLTKTNEEMSRTTTIGA